MFRAAHLDGRTVQAGESFHFDVHVFDTQTRVLPYFISAFQEAARQGMGPGRGRGTLLSVDQLTELGTGARLYDQASKRVVDGSPMWLTLDAGEQPVNHIRIRFLTPTELKSDGGLAVQPDFGAVLSRARDRVTTLRRLYGDGALDLNYVELGERARSVVMSSCDVRQVDADRRSSRTGQIHRLGGFVGVAEYRGELAEFLPLLRAAQWTGIGRQTVWGKGAVQVEIVS